MARPAKGHVGRQRKLECPSCGFIARASRGAVQTVGLPTCACGEPMVLPELRDLLELGMIDVNHVPSHELRALGYTDSVSLRRRNLGNPTFRRCSAEGCNRQAQAKQVLCRRCEEARDMPF